MSRKHIRLLSIILALVMIFALAACGNGDDDTTTTTTTEADETDDGGNGGETEPTVDEAPPPDADELGDRVLMTHWSGFTGADRPVLEQLIEEFNQNSDTSYIQLSVMEWGILDQKLTASVAARNGPDFFSYGPEILGKYDDLGLLVDIQSYYDSGSLDETAYPENVMDVMFLNGRYIAAPMCVFSTALYYNIDILAEHGFDGPPETLDEMFEMAREITTYDDNGEVVHYGAYFNYDTVFQALAWNQVGKPVVDIENKRTNITDPDFVAYLQTFADLVLEDEVQPGSAAAQALFSAERLAMYFVGPWDTTINTEAGINFDVAPQPGGPGGNLQQGHALMYIPTTFGEDKLDNFVEWMQHWSTIESQRTWSIGTGYPSVLADNSPLDDDEEWQASWGAKFSQSADLFTVRNYATLPSANVIFDTHLQTCWQNIVLGEKTVEEAVEEAANQINLILEDELSR